MHADAPVCMYVSERVCVCVSAYMCVGVLCKCL